MKDLVRYRAMESLCRQSAVFHPLDSWRLLAEAEMWHHKAAEALVEKALTEEALTEEALERDEALIEEALERNEAPLTSALSRPQSSGTTNLPLAS